MADAFRPLTLLLGALCLWALSVLVLALAGLGSRFPAATSEATPPRLPNVSLTRSQSRLGPMSAYMEVGARPLLALDRRPAPQIAADGKGGSADLDVTLTSVLITPRLQLAILTGNNDGASHRVRVGDTVEGSNWRLVQLEPRKAVIEGPTGQRVLDLRVFDGKGGAAPTPMVAGGNSAATRVGSDADRAAPPMSSPAPTATPSTNAEPKALPPVTQEQQVDAIRRRIEARRAQLRAEAEAAGSNDKK